MTKIQYNYSIINQSAVSNLDGSIEYIQKIIDTMNNMYIPSSFRSCSYLNDLKSYFDNRKSNVENIKELVIANNKMYDEIAASSNNEIYSISDIRISKRDTAIR